MPLKLHDPRRTLFAPMWVGERWRTRVQWYFRTFVGLCQPERPVGTLGLAPKARQATEYSPPLCTLLHIIRRGPWELISFTGHSPQKLDASDEHMVQRLWGVDPGLSWHGATIVGQRGKSKL